MRKYELMAIFPIDEESAQKGAADMRETLSTFGAEIEKEELFGERDLTYAIAKHTRGKFMLYTLPLNPDKLTDVDRQFKLNTHLLKYLFVRLDEKKVR